MRGSLHYATDDKAVRRFGRDDVSFSGVENVGTTTGILPLRQTQGQHADLLFLTSGEGVGR